MYQKKIIVSKDGSHTIELVGMNEQYHSTHGALQESNHIYIHHGLERAANNLKELHVLEIGMGTGLNVLLTWQFAKQRDLKMFYYAIEAFPIERSIWEQLNYAQLLDFPNSETLFDKIHVSNWGEEILLDEDFVFIKKDEKIQDAILPLNTFDMVYFDAFNPDLEPDLWTEDIFQKIYKSMTEESVLSTYSTKGIVKRALKNCGFSIEKKTGPPGKREILNAVKSL